MPTDPAPSNATDFARLVQGAPLPHESAREHVCGSAKYIDDYPEIAGTLHAALGLSTRAHAAITAMDLSPVAAADGVQCVLTAQDLQHGNDIGPVLPGDPLLADGITEYAGQALFALAADSHKQAVRARRLAQIAYQDKPAILSIEDALAAESYLVPPDQFHRIRRGDAAAAIAAAPHQLSGQIRIGGQEHFYLEGQAAYAIPQEDGGMTLISSTQHPSEVQLLAAKILGVRRHAVTVQVRRMGGAFGGKETQAAQTAILAAVLAQKTRRPVKLRLPRGDDFVLTGKRHPFLATYQAGVDDDGRVLGVQIRLAADCGMSPDLSLAIVDRAMFHADNAYHYPAADIVGIPCKTNKASNTAFRGFGGPQGMLLAERLMQDIAAHLKKDALEARRANLYRPKHITPYGQTITDDTLQDIMEKLAHSCDYAARQAAIARHNSASPVLKKGLALTPVKFGISFTTTFLNQAGALLVVYTDGSVLINHGGTEMGQGLHTKVQQVVAAELGIPTQQVRVTATATDKVPNTSPTAASSGADMNCMAAAAACAVIKQRLTDLLRQRPDCKGCGADDIVFSNGEILARGKAVCTFAELTRDAHLARVSLSATGYYRTPKIHYDRPAGQGRPFYYYACGAAATEVILDSFTGEYRLLRADILHDVGNPLNPAIDIGQIEGGYAQGAGWLTTEELAWNERGQPLVTGPATYKIPAAGDMPEDLRVALYTAPNSEETIYRSKAVGEPPLMLAISAWAALENAASAAAGAPVRLNAPATPEQLLGAIEKGRA